MSGTQVQYLAKQNRRLEAQVRTLLAAFEGLSQENEVMASVACAFAWDLRVCMDDRQYEDAPYGALDKWDEAVKAVGG